MVHYIYKITCLCGSLAGHYYIGKRTQRAEGERYYGSGSVIKKYYKKYPPVEGETIIKEILEFNQSQKENSRREKEILGDLFKNDPLCLNLKRGGEGGCAFTLSEETRRKMSQSRMGRVSWNKGKKFEDYTLEQQERTAHTLFKKGQAAHNKGVPMSEEQKLKCSKTWFKGVHVRQYDLDGNFIKEYESYKQASEETGVFSSGISLCCLGKQKQSGGYKWKKVV